MILVTVALATLLSLSTASGDAEQRGREIFLHGSDGTAPITARMGAGANTIPGTLLPCANCHGLDARGKTEGGVSAPAITAAGLARAANLGTRTRPAYTPTLLKRAITLGFDAGGNALDAAMPRFQLTQAQAGDLMAFLGSIGSRPASGVAEDRLRINVIGAPDLSAPDAPIYGRRVELSPTRAADAFLTIDVSPDPGASVIAAAADGMPTITLYPPPDVAIASRGAAVRPTLANVFVLTASAADTIAALESYPRRAGRKSTLMTEDCTRIDAIARDLLVLMTEHAASQCHLAAIPDGLDRRVIVAAAMPPAPDSARLAANAALAITLDICARLGRDLSRDGLRLALEKVYRVESPGLAPISWSADRHTGSQAAWLMTLDVPQQRLLGEPGWVEAE